MFAGLTKELAAMLDEAKARLDKAKSWTDAADVKIKRALDVASNIFHKGDFVLRILPGIGAVSAVVEEGLAGTRAVCDAVTAVVDTVDAVVTFMDAAAHGQPAPAGQSGGPLGAAVGA